MVIHNNTSNTANANASADAPYVSTNASVKESITNAKTANEEEVKKLVSYFATFDGSAEAAGRFQEAFRSMFHPDVVIELPGPGKHLNYDSAVECIQAVCNKGGYADLLDIVDNGNGTATMTISNNVPGLIKDDVPRQIAHFQDGKVIRVHAVDSDAKQFGRVVSYYQRCIPPSRTSNTDIASRHAAMLACFDGSRDAYAKAAPIIDEIFSSDLVVDVGSGPMDLGGFHEFAKSFSKQQNVAKLEQSETTADEIRVVIRNIVGGVDQGPVAQVGKIKDGKIVHWSADSGSNDQAGFDRLITSVAANQEGMAGNIQRLRDYLAALDGRSPDAFQRFEPHIDRVLSKNIVWENEDGDQMNYSQILELLRDKYIPNGCYPVLESVEVNEDGRSLTVVINNHLPGENGDPTHQILYYGDDDRIYRLVSGPLLGTCQRVAALPTE